jgi:hypothetical protein
VPSTIVGVIEAIISSNGRSTVVFLDGTRGDLDKQDGQHQEDVRWSEHLESA